MNVPVDCFLMSSSSLSILESSRYENSTVEIRREVFCDASARGIVKDFGRVNFISDIRSVDWTTHDGIT